MMIFGLSYWHVDRNELDEILLSLDNKMEVRFVNPKPPYGVGGCINQSILRIIYTLVTAS